MIDRFLRAKHWEVFILVFMLPLLLTIIPLTMIFTSIEDGSQPEPSALINFFIVSFVISIISAAGFLGWLWSIGVGLQRFIPTALRQNVTHFKIAMLIPISYFVLLGVLILVYGIEIFSAGEEFNPDTLFMVLPFILILHILSFFCMIYSFYFASKAVGLAEHQQNVTFGKFVGPFFMIWFYYIGVWVLQPKLNKLMEEGQLH